MTRHYNFDQFEFSELALPRNIDEDTDPSILRALSIYGQIKPDEFDASTIDGLNQINDELSGAGQRTFKSTERSSPLILGVANYDIPRGETDYAFIEGIAVHRNARGMGMGIYLINNLVELARADGLKAIEGNVRPSVEPFYEKLGFDYVEGSNNDVRMRLDIN